MAWIRTRHLGGLAVTCAACALAVLLVPATASAVPPVTSVTLSPSAPDGANGWWVTNPLVSLSSGQDGEVHWSWDGGGESSTAVSADTPFAVGVAADGPHVLSAFSVNLLVETGVSLSVSMKSDPLPPDQVTGLTGAVVPGEGIDFSWDVASDPISGLAGYLVYRSTLPEFLPEDVIGSSSSTTYRDVPPAGDGLFHYAVTAVDNAGNESVLSEPVAFASDLTPPTAPGDLQAWRNAAGFARISWVPASDAGAGLDHYELLRSVDGGSYSVIATVAPDALFTDDHDLPSDVSVTVDYGLAAVDRALLRGPEAGPAHLVGDTSAPAAPAAVRAVPVFDPPAGGSRFAVSWLEALAPGSGIASYGLLYGPGVVPSSSVAVTGYPPSRSLTVGTPASAALWRFAVRATDRAGNVSATSTIVGARSVTVDRVSGADRYATAVALSASVFETASAVVVASGQVYSDALAASGLAGALRAPILLVGPGDAPSGLLREIDRLRATRLYVIGGPGSVSVRTATSLVGAGRTVTRVWGADRYSTAAAVERTIREIKGGTSGRAYVVSGRDFADALSVASAAYVESAPVLFANDRAVPASTLNAVAASGATETVIAGGYGSVTRRADMLLPGSVRIGGADRYAVSRAFTTWVVARGILGLRAPLVASGRVFTDGLAASPVAGERRSPVMLADPSNARALGAYLVTRRAGFERITVAGGAGTLPETVRRFLFAKVSVP